MNADDNQPGYIRLGLETAGGGLALKHSLPRLLGKSTYYHGTSREAADKIKKEGLDPVHGGSDKGSGSLIGNINFKNESKGHVHLGSYSDAAAHAELAETKGFMPSWAMGKIKGLLRIPSKGTIFSVSLPYDEDMAEVEKVTRKSRKLKPNIITQYRELYSGNDSMYEFRKKLQELNKQLKGRYSIDPDLHGAIRTKEKVLPKNFGFKALFNDMSKVPAYIKKYPGRFGAGLGLAGAGSYAALHGISGLLDKLNNNRIVDSGNS